VARNRKRAKDRRAQRPPRPPSSRPGVADARANGHEDSEPGLNGHEVDDELDAAAAELEERQAALEREIVGFAETGEPTQGAAEPDGDDEPFDPPSVIDSGDAEIAEEQIVLGARHADEPVGEELDFDQLAAARMTGDEDDEELLQTPRETAVARHRGNPIGRLVHFLQGSWRELQRVQWPDRRQVMQATGVVIGFVIVAGIFLGASDWVAGKIVNFIIG
jgi:preprotein translocase subunit SecE